MGTQESRKYCMKTADILQSQKSKSNAAHGMKTQTGVQRDFTLIIGKVIHTC